MVPAAAPIDPALPVDPGPAAGLAAVVGPLRRRAVVSAGRLARAYDAQIAACWRGDGDGCHFLAWLAFYRHPGLFTPVGPPDAVSVHGAGGRGIMWYEGAEAIIGIVPGQPWGYRVPIGAAPPLIDQPARSFEPAAGDGA